MQEDLTPQGDDSSSGSNSSDGDDSSSGSSSFNDSFTYSTEGIYLTSVLRSTSTCPHNITTNNTNGDVSRECVLPMITSDISKSNKETMCDVVSCQDSSEQGKVRSISSNEPVISNSAQMLVCTAVTYEPFEKVESNKVHNDTVLAKQQ